MRRCIAIQNQRANQAIFGRLLRIRKIMRTASLLHKLSFRLKNVVRCVARTAIDVTCSYTTRNDQVGGCQPVMGVVSNGAASLQIVNIAVTAGVI